MELDYKAIGKRIKLARINAEITQEQLAEILGVTTPYVSRLEGGAKSVNLKRLIEIANVLTPDSLDPLVCDNLREHKTEYNNEATELLADCDAFEQAQLIEQMRDNKARMRKLKEHYQK